MNLIEPVLFPINPDIFNTLKFLEPYSLNECDLYINYNYQVKEYMLLTTYVDSSLMLYFNDNIRGLETYEEVVDSISDNMYNDYLKYFLFKYMKDRDGHYLHNDFIQHLKGEHSFAVKKSSKTQLIDILSNRYYNTVVIPSLWDFKDPNSFNRLFDEPANYFDQLKTVGEAWEQLMMGGKMYVIRPRDYGKVLFNIGDDYNEIEAGVFQKDRTLPPKTNKLKLWL